MKKILRGLPACALVSLVTPVWADESSNQYTLDIEQQPIVAALTEFSRQTGLQVGYLPASPEEENTIAAPLKGQYTVESGLKEMLAPSGLGFEKVNERTISVTGSGDRKRTPRVRAYSMRTELSESPRWRVASWMDGDSDSSQSPSYGEDNGSEKGAAARQHLPEGRRSNENEEIVVIGSRIPRTAAMEGAQDVRTFGREEIKRSGQTTVSGFLNTLPSAAISSQEPGGWQGSFAATTVQLRGMPVGSTLVLINGYRVETSGTQQFNSNTFDLNNIPLGAVERIEVLASGASALYGSDAIAGVVNVVLSNNFQRLNASARYGSASGVNESSASIAWGQKWERGRVSIVGSFQERNKLHGAERKLTASNDYTSYGGPDANRPLCNPGNVFFPNGFSFNNQPAVPYAAVPAGLVTPTVDGFAATAGTLNTCAYVSRITTVIPGTRRAGMLLSAEYELTDSVSLFSDILYSHVEQRLDIIPAALFGIPAFQQFTVPASNPYNPFGTKVGVAYDFGGGFVQTLDGDTDFFRPLVGARGALGGSWVWEVAASQSQDWTDSTGRNQWSNPAAIQSALNSSDPAVALNPFIDGPAGPEAWVASFFRDGRGKFSGRRQAVNAFVRGKVFELPAGAVQLAIGGEYAREEMYSKGMSDPFTSPDTYTSTTRATHIAAAFGEMRVPILSASGRAGEALALTLAARYDDYQQAGGTTNPQFGVEWRPGSSLLVRGTYGNSFKAPSLYNLFRPRQTFTYLLTDPTTGALMSVPARRGGNPDLLPERGQSTTVGLVYASQEIPGLTMSVTHWDVRQTNRAQDLTPQAILDNEAVFPERVIRDQADAIQLIEASTLNFGTFEVAGLDYSLSYEKATTLGDWSGSIAATQTYRYDTQLVPGAVTMDRVSKADSSGAWAPRWKGGATLGWQRGPYEANVGARYVSRYQDYGNTTREIGNFWLYDARFGYDFGQSLASGRSWLKGAQLTFGAVNLFDTLPQYSNFGNSLLGYDPAQADIRGRQLYLEVGIQL